MDKCIEKLIKRELKDANEKFPPFASAHEGYAILKEEIEEANDEMIFVEYLLGILWQYIKENDEVRGFQNIAKIKERAIAGIKELIQVAAMCDKFEDSANAEPSFKRVGVLDLEDL
jgi:hypothetical protein